MKKTKTIEDLKNYLDDHLKSANEEWKYCHAGYFGEKPQVDDYPDLDKDDWSESMVYADEEIEEIKHALHMVQKYEEYLDDESN